MAKEVVILDIEGTICSISFVKDVLYPFFLKKLPAVLDGIEFPVGEKSTGQIEQVLLELPDNVRGSAQAVSDHFVGLVKADIKDPVLKSFQGIVWKQGYDEGEILAPLYEDAIQFIREHRERGLKLYIYSSGSIAAQKLLFKYVRDGKESVDLNSYIDGYFDITVAGSKVDPQSYTKILETIRYKESPESVLFLSDNINEVQASIEAGIDSNVVIRPGNAPISDKDLSRFMTIKSLDDVKL